VELRNYGLHRKYLNSFAISNRFTDKRQAKGICAVEIDGAGKELKEADSFPNFSGTGLKERDV
jgi:hypothetical protein